MGNTIGESPSLARVLGGIYISLKRSIVGGEIYVIQTIMISQRSGPQTTSIHCSLLHVVFGSVVKRGKDIAHGLPVDEVFGVHHWSTGHELHSGIYMPIVIAHTDDIRFGHICSENGIFASALHRQDLLGKALTDDTISFGGIMERVAGTRTVF